MTEPKFKHAFFIPHVGKHYDKGINGKKVLVLGASFYCDKDCKYRANCTDLLTRDSSKYNLTCPEYNGKKDENGNSLRLSNEPSNVDDSYSAYKIFEKLFIEATGIEDMWNHITFTNYVQFFLPSKETKEEYLTERDYLAFIEVVQHHEYDPDVIIVWGKPVREELQRRLPETCKSIDKIRNRDRVLRVHFYNENKARVLVFMHHPITAYLSKEIWDKDFDEMTENIKIALQ